MHAQLVRDSRDRSQSHKRQWCDVLISSATALPFDIHKALTEEPSTSHAVIASLPAPACLSAREQHLTRPSSIFSNGASITPLAPSNVLAPPRTSAKYVFCILRCENA